jgi:hypothetical protein
MDEIEVPLEGVQEKIHEEAHHAVVPWMGKVALSAALLAVLAAISALMAGHHANEAMIEQIRSSNKWNYYQAKGIKDSLLQSRMQILESMGKPVSEKDQEKSAEYKKQQEEISKEAKEMDESSEAHLAHHNTLAKSVTFFQVAIAISAISILVRRSYRYRIFGTWPDLTGRGINWPL